MFIKAEPNFADGFDGQIALRLVFSGCRKAEEGNPCPGCHNPDLWSFNQQGKITMQEFKTLLLYWKQHMVAFDCVSIIGGEPLDQEPNEVALVFDLINETYGELPVITYTGYTKEDISRIGLIKHPAVSRAAYVKFGPYMENERPKGKLASSNQVMTKVGITPDGITFTEINF